MNEPSLASLQEFAAFLGEANALTERLEELAPLVVRSLKASACAISLLTEDGTGAPILKWFAICGPLSEEDWNTAMPANGASANPMPRAKPQLTELKRSSLAARANEKATIGASYIAVPLAIEGRAIGMLHLVSQAGQAAFDETDLALATVVAAMIAKAIQADRLQLLLRSRIAQNTLVRESKKVAMHLTGGAVPPSRLAKILAKSFYKDLAQAGFEHGQIIEAASEIIAQITSDVERFGKRLARKGK